MSRFESVIYLFHCTDTAALHLIVSGLACEKFFYFFLVDAASWSCNPTGDAVGHILAQIFPRKQSSPPLLTVL